MLMRWDPFAELSRFDAGLGRMWSNGAPKTFEPAIDVVDEEGAIVIYAEVPGVKAEELSIQIDEDVLTLSGERKVEREKPAGKLHRVERSHGAFRRSFVLPKSADGASIDASLKDGVLTLRIPKKGAPEKRRIEVKSHS